MQKSWQDVICRQIEMLVVVLSVNDTVEQEGSECMTVLKAIWPTQLTYIDIRFTFSVMDLYAGFSFIKLTWTHLDLETVSTFVYTQPMEIRFEITEIKQY